MLLSNCRCAWFNHTKLSHKHKTYVTSYARYHNISQIARISYRWKYHIAFVILINTQRLECAYVMFIYERIFERQCLFVYWHRFQLYSTSIQSQFQLWIQARALTDYNFTVQLRTQMASSKSNYVRMKPHSPLFIIIICELWHSTACSTPKQFSYEPNTHIRTHHWICSHRKYHYPYNRCIGV